MYVSIHAISEAMAASDVDMPMANAPLEPCLVGSLSVLVSEKYLVCDLRERVWVLVSGRDFCSYLRQPLEPLRTLARLGYYLQEGLWGSGCFFCSYLRHPLDPLRTWLLSARKGLGCGVLGLARFGFCSYLRHLDRPTLATLGYYQTCEKGPGVWGRVWGLGFWV